MERWKCQDLEINVTTHHSVFFRDYSNPEVFTAGGKVDNETPLTLSNHNGGLYIL